MGEIRGEKWHGLGWRLPLCALFLLLAGRALGIGCAAGGMIFSLPGLLMAAAALIAAAIKCSDLVLPQSTAIRVLNPAVSILLEALVVFVFVEVYSKKRIYLKSFAMGLGWMLLFVMTQALIFKPAEGLYRMPLAEMLGFIVFNTVVSGLLTGTYLKKPAIFRWQLDPQKLSYVQPAIIIALAVVCELGNSLMF